MSGHYGPLRGQTQLRPILDLHQFGNEYFAFRLWADQQGKNDASRAEHRADQHGRRISQMLLDSQIGNDRRNEATKKRSDVVAETACRAANFGWEAFAQITRADSKQRPA